MYWHWTFNFKPLFSLLSVSFVEVKKHQTMSCSSAEAKYRALVSTTRELQWIFFLLQDLGQQPMTLSAWYIFASSMSETSTLTQWMSSCVRSEGSRWPRVFVSRFLLKISGQCFRKTFMSLSFFMTIFPSLVNIYHPPSRDIRIWRYT